MTFRRHLAYVPANICALLNGAFEAHAIEAFSSLAVMIWNNSSAPRVSRWTYPTSSRHSKSSLE